MPKVNFKPISVPNYVIDANNPDRFYNVKELTEEELTELADSFTINLFLKAKGKYKNENTNDTK